MQLSYRFEGEGTTLVLNHGWVTSHRYFDRQRDLSRHFRLLLWDFPGHGDSEKNPRGYQVEDLSRALRQVLVSEGIEEALGLGWSMGATVLWDYVRLFGEKPFRAFINIDSLPWADPDHFKVSAVKFSFERNRAHAQRKFIQRMFVQKPEAAVLEMMLAESLKCPNEIALRLYADLAGTNHRAVFQGLQAPVLSVMGRQGFYGPGVSELLGLKEGQEVQWFENSGHLPFWEEADRFNSLLLDRFA
ncbi:MAG TPA: alpha/beta hydrolase [bacterium]|nr:alpha/beta hydrolase [bacterium]